MNYKGILTEEAAKGFREEGIITAVLLLHKDINVQWSLSHLSTRSIELDLNDLDDKRMFSIAGKTTAGIFALEKTFCGSILNNRRWYPFDSLFKSTREAEKVVREVAFAADCEPHDLEWGLIEYER